MSAINWGFATDGAQARIDIDKSGARCKVRLTGSQAPVLAMGKLWVVAVVVVVDVDVPFVFVVFVSFFVVVAAAVVVSFQ